MIALVLLAAVGTVPEPAATSTVPLRSEHYVKSTEGQRIFVRRVQPRGPSRGAVVLTHGAGSPASAVWDLPHGCSIQARLAAAGYDTFTVDVRGFGGSSRPASMGETPEGAPAVRARDVMPDVDAVVDLALSTSGHRRADLVGWSWGSLVAGMYAGHQPEKVRKLVLFAPVFDRKWPTRHRTEGRWRTEARDLHMKWLDPKKEDPRVREAYVQALFRFVPEAQPLQLPNGPYRDVYGEDAPVWSPEAVQAETLVVRGSADRASLREHALRLFEQIGAHRKQYLELAGAGHFAFRTRRSPELQQIIAGFLD